jgi:hypothetical protein
MKRLSKPGRRLLAIAGVNLSSATEHRWWPLSVGVPVLVALTALFSAPPGVGCCLGIFVWALVACLGVGASWIRGRE